MFYYSGDASKYFLPESASEHGLNTDRLFWITLAVISFAFVATNLLLFFFPFKYQYKETRTAQFYPDNHKLEIIWTIIPAIVMAVLVIYGWVEWSNITSDAPEEAVEIEIMGKQFNWQVRYPGMDGKLGKYDPKRIDGINSMGVDFSDDNSRDDFMPGTLILPKGRPVALKIRSRDVLHSVFLPHFRVKMDAVPGMPTSFWFTPTVTTEEMREKLKAEGGTWNDLNSKGKPRWEAFNYELACTEICGNSHYAMKFAVKVVDAAEYDKWMAEQKPWADGNSDYVKEKFALEVTSSNDEVYANK